jgi:hypothetical protein
VFGQIPPHVRALLLILAVAFGAGSVGSAWAGPNAGAKLVLHYNPSLTYTTDGGSYYDGYSNLNDCKDAVTKVSAADGTPVVFYLLIAFDGIGSPHVKACGFGISFSSPLVAPIASGPCNGDPFAVYDDAWPANGSGVGLSWDYPLTRDVNEIFWFASYSYANQWFKVTAPPRQGAEINNGDMPPEIDYVGDVNQGHYYSSEYFGMIGFGKKGNSPCNPDESTGACCSSVGDCIIQTRVGCAAYSGYTYMGDDAPCNPNPCEPGSGACCVDGDCEIKLWDDCIAHGVWIGMNIGCDPSPCGFGESYVNWGVVKTKLGDRR